MTSSLRKKSVVALLLVSLGVLSWQIYTLFVDTGFKVSLRSKVENKLALNKSDQVVKLSQQPTSSMAAVPSLSATKNAQSDSSITAVNTPVNNNDEQAVKMVQPSLQLQNNGESQAQKSYLNLVREYQTAQMKRLIAQDYEAIAVANRNAAKAIVQTKTMHVKPSVLPQFTLGAKKSKPATPQKQYELVYTGEQGGHWNATIRYNNKLLDINLGTELANGEKVQTINQKEVVLSKDDRRTTISFFGVHTQKIVSASAPTNKPKQFDAMSNLQAKPQTKQIQLSAIHPVNLLRQSKPNTTEQKLAARRITTKKPVIKQVLPKAIVSQPATHRQYTKREQTLLTRNSKYYTIVLRSSNNIHAIQRYLQQNGLAKRASYYKRRLNGKPNYVAIYGQYPNAASTLAAIADLPIQLQRWSPSVKPNRAVKREIRSA